MDAGREGLRSPGFSSPEREGRPTASGSPRAPPSDAADSRHATPTASSPSRSRSRSQNTDIAVRAHAQAPCMAVHVPYSRRTGWGAAAFNRMRVVQCKHCGSGWVPEVLLSTVPPPLDLPILGNPEQLTVVAARRIDRSRGAEASCEQVSRNLVFLELDAQRQLLTQLRCLGRNSAFDVRHRLQLRNEVLVLVMTCTALLCTAMPLPPTPSVTDATRLPLAARTRSVASAMLRVAGRARRELE